jgi:nucleotide-binding universal stress UspA family protein
MSKVKVTKILVGVDGSEYSDRAFQLASFLAARCGAMLLIANILEIIGVEGTGSFTLSKRAKRELKQGGNLMLLERYRSQARDAGVSDVRTLTMSGHVAEMILKVADLEEVDMIVLGRRGLNAPKEFLLGSVSYNVSHHAKCPVIIAR